MECRGSGGQTYECEVVHKGISFDACLAKELFYLWDRGITTTGSCCGKHANVKEGMSFIGVIEKDIPKMKTLGYVVRENEMDKSREDGFIPKTIL